jgi:hypothetical protein
VLPLVKSTHYGVGSNPYPTNLFLFSFVALTLEATNEGRNALAPRGRKEKQIQFMEDIHYEYKSIIPS